MTGFLALVGPTGPAPDALAPDATWQGAGIRLLAAQADRPGGPALAARGGRAVAADLRLDGRAALRQRLGAPDASDAALILAAYERWGEAFVDHVEGAYAAVVWDGPARRAVAARDALGLRPLYRARLGDGWALGSSLRDLRRLVPFDVDPVAVADFLTGDYVHPTRTLVAGVERVPPAHTVRIDADGALQERRYWALDPDRRLPDDDDTVERAFREAFDAAVGDRLDDATGAFLSGGLDSTSIVATARALRPEPPLPVFALVYDDQKADERRYIDAAIDQGGLVPHRVRGESPSLMGRMRDDLRALGAPSLAPNLFLTRHLYDAARQQGLRAVLDGFGGDNVVAHGEQRLTELALGLRWPTFAREAVAAAARTTRPRRMVLDLVRDFALAPLAEPFRRPTPAVHFGRADLVGERSLPDARYRTVRASHLAELGAARNALALEAAYATAAASGVEPRFPFFDRRVVEVCLAIPSAQRLRGGLTRSFLRRAMSGRLPDLVRDRSGKARIGGTFADALFHREPASTRQAVYDEAPQAADYLDVAALQRAFERAHADPAAQAELALPVWRAVSLARWLADTDANAPDAP